MSAHGSAQDGALAAGAASRTLAAALALALAAAVSLGLARFSYALLLPPMRQDLGWSYVTAGGMNTFNAVGYLLGALAMPRLMRRFDARALMLVGGAAAALLLAAHAATRADAVLVVLRTATGVGSALSFVGGGLLAARLASLAPARAGLVLGIYYGGVGLGIIGSALLVPPIVDAHAARWPAAWLALAAAAAFFTLLTAVGTRGLGAPPPVAGERVRFAPRTLAFGLAGYAMFGLGYIAYMTFIITLLREQGLSGAATVGFFVLLGAGVLASSWLWAGLLQRHRDGRPMALLNALLALATVLPVASTHPLSVYASGALFGGVFLSVVASTTALVRHNLEPAAWPAGIAVFTIVFAAGQIIGPAIVGWIADLSGGLATGFVASAAMLGLGALLASLQRALPPR
ncbi:MAG: YbfB/YjiJ family MFS transporter [Rubrivivax sp.]|nr:YbfB/YjiJ family MFS transporter [Rubrivivax sp.]